MSAAGIPLIVSTFPLGKSDGPAYGHHWHTTWAEFTAHLGQRREGEKDGPCFATATFALELDGWVRRLKTNVTARTLIALDIETSKKTGEIPPPIDETMECAARNGWACAAYTSHNHKPDTDVRYRLILPLTSAVTADLPCPEVVADHLGLSGVLDTSKVGAASLFYFPSCPVGLSELHECMVQDGAPLDTDRLRAAADLLYRSREAERERIAAEAHQAAAARQAARLAAGFDPNDSLIEKLRAHYDLAAVLEAHGYDRAGNKFRHSNSSSGMHGADIKTFGGIERVFSHNATDALHADNLPDWCGTVTALDVVDVLVILAHGGDRRRALADLATKHGLDKTEERRELAKLLFRMIRQGAPQTSIEEAAYALGEVRGLSRQDVNSVARWVVEQPARGRAA